MAALAYEALKDRGFIAQVTAEEALAELMARGITCYVGFDPTASALHVGHLLPIMALMPERRASAKAISEPSGAVSIAGMR